jgi:CheY-like chemotaxis protein
VRDGDAPSPKPRQNSKILAAHRYIISVNALTAEVKETGRTQSALVPILTRIFAELACNQGVAGFIVWISAHQTNGSCMTVRTVLIAENDENDAFFIRRALAKGSDVVAHVVNDGGQAMQYLRGRGIYSDRKDFPMPDLILLDLDLPRRGGLDILREIRSDPDLKPLKVLVVTASDSPRDMDAAMQMGAVSYLVKPTDMAEFLASVQQAAEDFLKDGGQSAPDTSIQSN